MTNLQDFTNRSEVGTIKPWGKATAPSGYLLCDGTAVSRTTYAELYVVLGDTYGAGNGSTTFNVPQLQGKTAQGYDGNTYNLAATGGANTVTVAVTNNQAVNSAVNSTLANNQAVSVTGTISNTALTEAQLASHCHSPLCLCTDVATPGDRNYVFLGISNITRDRSCMDANTYRSGNLWETPIGSGTGHTHAHTLSGTLTGSVAVTSTLSGSAALTNAITGSVTAAGNNTFSPYVVVNYIIKH